MPLIPGWLVSSKMTTRRKETLNAMSIDDWRLAVYHEMQADLWYEVPHSEDEAIGRVITLNVSSVTPNGNGTAPKVDVAAASGNV